MTSDVTRSFEVTALLCSASRCVPCRAVTANQKRKQNRATSKQARTAALEEEAKMD